MKYLIVGLGSMGKRRIRCLKALQINEIYGFDLRKDRTNEAKETYGIQVFNDFEEAIRVVQPGALIISVPPHKHHIYVKYAVEHKLHFFVEASVIDDDMEDVIAALKKEKIVAAPSATMVFHPAIQAITSIIKSGELGKISNILLHVGQYLPDWHTYEKVSDYYVSNPATGGAREIIPFELTWFTKTFGFPRRVAGNYRHTIQIEGAEYIDDTYNALMDYGTHLAIITVDVVSRYATRRLTINGSKKQLVWSWDQNCIKVFDPAKNAWEERPYQMAKAQAGYNPNIGENMYIEELNGFVDAIKKNGQFMNTMEEDLRVLRLLYKIEESDKLARFVEV